MHHIGNDVQIKFKTNKQAHLLLTLWHVIHHWALHNTQEICRFDKIKCLKGVFTMNDMFSEKIQIYLHLSKLKPTCIYV